MVIELTRISQLRTSLQFSRDRNLGRYQQELLNKFIGLLAEGRTVEVAAKEAGKSSLLANSIWFCDVVLIARAHELGYKVSSVQEARRFIKTKPPLVAAHEIQISGFDELPVETKDSITIKGSNIVRHPDLIREKLRRLNRAPCAYRAIQHSRDYGYSYSVVAFSDRVSIDPPGLEMVFSDNSQGFRYFIKGSDGRYGYEEITIYFDGAPPRTSEPIVLEQGKDNGKNIRRLAFLEAKSRVVCTVQGNKTQLRNSFLTRFWEKDGIFTLEFLTCYGDREFKYINLEEEGRVVITLSASLSRLNS